MAPVSEEMGKTSPMWKFTASPILRNGITPAGRDVTYTRLDGVQHNAWDYAYNEKLLTWLLQHTR